MIIINYYYRNMIYLLKLYSKKEFKTASRWQKWQSSSLCNDVHTVNESFTKTANSLSRNLKSQSFSQSEIFPAGFVSLRRGEFSVSAHKTVTC